MIRSQGRRVVGVLVVLATAVALTGCGGPTLASLPLPGSGVSGDTITVKVPFDEALNLAQGAAVKVNGVDSGKVQSVTAKDFKALAVLKVRRSAKLRSTATARLRYTTPLGELIVDVSNPSTGPLMQPGETLVAKQATTAPTVEDALSSASLLINGGGLSQLQVVTTELNKALGGREQRVRDLLSKSDTFLKGANATTADFLRALDALATFSKTMRANDKTIRAALRDLGPAAKVLRQNTPGLTRLLAQVKQFARTANGMTRQTRSGVLSMLREVSPVLDEILHGAQIGPSLRALISVGSTLDAIAPGDYINLFFRFTSNSYILPALPLALPGAPATAPSSGKTTKPKGSLLSPLDGILGPGGLLSGLTGGKPTKSGSGGAAGSGSLLGLGGLLGGSK